MSNVKFVGQVFKKVAGKKMSSKRKTGSAVESSVSLTPKEQLYAEIQTLEYINNSLHLERKYARIFVRGHYLFRDANSFPRAKLGETCELPGKELGHIRSREAFRPMARAEKYLMDYNPGYPEKPN